MEGGELLAMDLNQGTRPAAASIRLRLKTRELPKRCFAFTGRFLIAARRAVYPLEFFGSPQTQESISPKSETPDSPLEGSTNAESETQEQRNGILRLKRDSRSFEKRQLLCERIVATYKRIASLLDGTSESEIPSPEVYLDRERSLQPPNDNLVVLHPDLTINEENFPYLASAFPQLLPLSFVFASNLGPSEEIKDRIFAACEWTIAKDYGLAFGDEAAHYAKRNWKALAKLRHRIEEADPSFYNGLWSLRCFSESLEKTVNTVAVKRLGEKFAIYLAETNTSKINSRRVHFFLSQFPDDLVEPMLEVLNQVKIFQPEEYRGFFDGFSQQDCIFAPLELQAQAKSGGLMSYYAPPELQGRVKTFEDALSQGEQPIVFFEESVLSGSQTADIISQWQGKPSRENLSRELTPDEVQMLRRRCNGKLHLLFMFGLQAGVERLKHEASEFGFEVDVELAFDLADLGGPFDSGDFPKKAELREFLERVGESLLRSTKLPDSTGKWSEELILNRRFGYGNRGAVVLTPFNCPTSSITALWKRGIFQGKSWMPLFVRRQEPPFPNWDLFNQSQPAR